MGSNLLCLDHCLFFFDSKFTSSHCSFSHLRQFPFCVSPVSCCFPTQFLFSNFVSCFLGFEILFVEIVPLLHFL